MLPVWLAQAIETEEERSKMEQLYGMTASGQRMLSMIHLSRSLTILTA